jgi:SulP family sulfate permease
MERQRPGVALVVDLKNVIYVDSSGADSLIDLVRTCRKHQIRLVLCGLNHQPLDISRRSGLLELFEPADLQPDLASGILAALAPAGRDTVPEADRQNAP